MKTKREIKVIETGQVFEIDSEDEEYYYYIDVEPEVHYVSHDMALDGCCPEREGEEIVDWHQVVKQIEKNKCELI